MGDREQVVFCQYRNAPQPAWLCFDDLVEVVETWQPAEVLAKLQTVEQSVSRGLYAAGFLAYEAARGMDKALCTHGGGKLPLVWFGLFRRMVQQDAEPDDRRNGFSVGPWRPSIAPVQYDACIDRIRDYIARGHTYQVNYTIKLQTDFHGDAWSFFRRLCAAQRGQYGAYLDLGQQVVCSASPELFFRLEGNTLLTQPMKGTCARGLTPSWDRQNRMILERSVKDRAENAMVVDMMRNDVGRVADKGSVQVVSAFKVEKFPTVYQMTSCVMARTSASFAEIMQALFPSASITGAPKVRTMQIIRELEPDARGVYTGCIGWLAPGRKAEFNVAIRTVTIDRTSGDAEYGVGGGIVWDSNKAGEYSECLTKAAVLTAEIPPFELLETFVYDGVSGYFLLEGHLQRLADSADYFDFRLDLAEVRARLAAFGRGLPGGTHRVRLLVARGGRLSLQSSPLAAGDPSRPWKLKLTAQPIHAGNVFLYHKTTHRRVYETAFASRGDCDDVILWNEQGQVTETTIANLVVEKDGRLVTPPLACGLLPGVFRAHLLQIGQVHEEIVTLEDLRQAPRLFAVNSLRRWIPVARGF
ncbi:MAG: aminodeoxychorismate synthase component I [Thermoguttaceae bacterium]